jgi:hypothetical protein
MRSLLEIRYTGSLSSLTLPHISSFGW